MPGIPLGECRSCGAALSYFARACPNCGAANLPNPVATIVALAVVVVVGISIALAARTFLADRDAAIESARDAASAEQNAEGREPYGWLVKAMAECEEEAKRNTDKLYFLIVPLARTPTNLPAWEPDSIGPVGDSALLLPSANAVIGLRNGSLTLYREPLAFAVTDPATNAVYRWNPASGVTVLTARDAGFEQLRLGFQFADKKEIEWGFAVSVSRGTCYWIYPLVQPSARSG